MPSFGQKKNGPPKGDPFHFVKQRPLLVADVAPELEEVKQVVDIHLAVASEITGASVWVIATTWIVGSRIVVQSFRIQATHVETGRIVDGRSCVIVDR